MITSTNNIDFSIKEEQQITVIHWADEPDVLITNGITKEQIKAAIKMAYEDENEGFYENLEEQLYQLGADYEFFNCNFINLR